MKITATAIIILAFTLTACLPGQEATAPPITAVTPTTTTVVATTTTTAPPTTAPPTTPAPTTTEAPLPGDVMVVIFDQVVRDGAPDLSADLAPAGTKAMADEICRQLDSGESMAIVSIALLSSLTEEGYSPIDTGVLLGASISAFCPEYSGEMEAFFATLEQ